MRRIPRAVLHVRLRSSGRVCDFKPRLRPQGAIPSESWGAVIERDASHAYSKQLYAIASSTGARMRRHRERRSPPARHANARHIWESPLLRKREGAFFMPIPAQRPPAAMGHERVEEHHPRTLTCAARSCKRKGRKVAESGNCHQETAGRTRKHAAWGSRGRWFESSPPDQRNRRSDGKNVWPVFHFRAPFAARCCTSVPSSIKV